MKKFMTAFIAILTICIATTSCKKDETKKTTQVTINVKNGAGVAQSGLSVYMYSKTVFTTQGNDPFFAGKTATTGSDGNAVFNIVNPDDVLWTSSNTSEELYFGIVYTLGGINKEKHTVITVSEGDTKSANLVAN
jgi:hypothetical protein